MEVEPGTVFRHDCTVRLFRDWKGWPGRHRSPVVPELTDQGCPDCGGWRPRDPRDVRYLNVHSQYSTGLPNHSTLTVCSPERGGPDFLLSMGCRTK